MPERKPVRRPLPLAHCARRSSRQRRCDLCGGRPSAPASELPALVTTCAASSSPSLARHGVLLLSRSKASAFCGSGMRSSASADAHQPATAFAASKVLVSAPQEGLGAGGPRAGARSLREAQPSERSRPEAALLAG